MIEELIKEIEELKKYKFLYECQLKDKQRMSDMLFELMTKEYENTPLEVRKEKHIREQCKDCRGEWCDCDHSRLPEDVYKPKVSDKAWIPAITICKDFEWS